MGFAAGAQAAILVSNVGQREVGNRIANPQTWRAQPFQTGTNVDAGYVLESVELKLLAPPAVGRPIVSIRRDAGGDPSGRDLYTLTNPSRLGTGLNTFTAPNGAKLDANAIYWVVLRTSSAGMSFKVVGSDAGIDSGAAAGWTILPRHEQRER